MAKRKRGMGPARAGFTYGYQWSEHQPLPELRFPMDFESVKLYPVIQKGAVELMPEFPNSKARWHPSAPIDRLVPQYEAGTFDSVDFARVVVALDWHMEHGFDLNPFHASGRSWGVKRVEAEEKWFRASPEAWMNALVSRWAQYTSEHRHGAPSSLWWLDTEIRNSYEWWDLRERLWPSDDRHDVEVEDFENEDGLPPDEPDIDGGDITTEDHHHWFQYGRLYVTGSEWSLVDRMNTDHFWPNVWFIDDHGGAVPVRGLPLDPPPGQPR